MGTRTKQLSIVLACVVAVLLLGASRNQPTWESPYTPTRLEWLALQCNVNHRQRYEFVHSTYLAEPPNKINAVVKFAEKAKSLDPELRKGVTQAATDYVRDLAKAMGWTEPVEVEVTEVFH
ncbi:MAG: hypothetical protein AB7O59_23005 [Pirellulales bacterium]